MDFTNEDKRRLEDEAQIGGRFKNFKADGSFGILKVHILDKLRKTAVELLANSVDPEDKTAIIAVQQKYKVADDIEKMIDTYIHQGEFAQNTINNLNNGLPEQEDD